MMAGPVQRRGTIVHRPIHFEIPSENRQRAIAFYTALFGWQMDANAK
jgi:predicted enzyme related to lactoylglutathione lyase